MASVIYVTCRTLESSKCSRNYYHIAKVKWTQDSGNSGTFTRQQIVDWLNKSPDNEAFTRTPDNKEARIQVHTCGDHQYIETYADSTKVNNLRELNDC